MKQDHRHTSHPQVVNRLKRADGHLRNVIGMLERQDECLDVVQQLHAVERAIAAAKKALIQDHLGGCLDEALKDQSKGLRSAMQQFKDIAKYL